MNNNLPTPDIVELNIPGKMQQDEMAFLARLAARVPDGGCIIEIGPFYGRSTNVIASAAPHAHITSIDTFEDDEWIRNYGKSSPDIPPFSMDAWKHFTSKFDNVGGIQGYSPDVVSDWSKPIDMYFEDAIHGNPGLKANMDFWIKHLKPGGIVCGHDYSLRFPDVKREAEIWAERWGTRVEVVNSLWAITKPKEGETSPLISSDIGDIYETPTLRVTPSIAKLGKQPTLSGYWAGAFLEPRRLMSIEIDFVTPQPDLEIEYMVAHPQHGSSGWVAAGKPARVLEDNKARPIWQFAARLKGAAAKDYTLCYRAGFRQVGNGGHALSEATDWFSDGAVCIASNPGAAMTALTIAVMRDKPRPGQSGLKKPAKQKVEKPVSLLGKIGKVISGKG